MPELCTRFAADHMALTCKNGLRGCGSRGSIWALSRGHHESVCVLDGRAILPTVAVWAAQILAAPPLRAASPFRVRRLEKRLVAGVRPATNLAEALALRHQLIFGVHEQRDDLVRVQTHLIGLCASVPGPTRLQRLRVSHRLP